MAGDCRAKKEAGEPGKPILTGDTSRPLNDRHVKDRLCEIDGESCSLHHRLLLLSGLQELISDSGTLMPAGSQEESISSLI